MKPPERDHHRKQMRIAKTCDECRKIKWPAAVPFLGHLVEI
jgi:hypothetical protein